MARLSFRMPLYPLPARFALAGGLYVFTTLDRKVIAYGLVSLAIGLLAFVSWDRAASAGAGPAETSPDAALELTPP